MILQNGKSVGEWLFDCGDRHFLYSPLLLVTTHQILSLQRQTKSYIDSARQSNVLLKTSRLSKIFISHMHGDHIYGLPALLTDIGLSRIHKTARAYVPVDIYGPPGLAEYLKMVFQLTDTKSNYPCIVHELYSDPNDSRLGSIDSSSGRLQYKDKRIVVDPVFPSNDGFWNLFRVFYFPFINY